MARNIRLIAAGTEDTHDFCLNEKRQLFEVSGIDAYAQIINCKMRTILGEKQLNMEDGLPYFQTVFSDITTIPIWVAEVRKMLEALPFVMRVESISTNVQDGVLTYKSIIVTDLGTTEFSGAVNEKQVRDVKRIKLSSTAVDEEREPTQSIIRFVTEDGMAPIAPLIAIPGSPITLPKPIKGGEWFFSGWYTNPEFTEQFTSNVMPDEDTTLYAKFDLESWTKLQFRIDASKFKNAEKYFDLKLRVWSHDETKPVRFKVTNQTNKYNNGFTISRVCTKSNGARESIKNGTLVTLRIKYDPSYTEPAVITIDNKTQIVNAKFSSIFMNVEIDSNCFKFRVGDTDVADQTSAVKIPDETQKSIIRMFKWSSTIKNMFRTFSYCENLQGTVPDWPANIGVPESWTSPSISINDYGNVGGTYEHTKISNAVAWISGIVRADYCYASCVNINSEIPIIEDFGNNKRLTNVDRVFTACLNIKPTPKGDLTDEEYNNLIMPSFVTAHNQYVYQTRDNIRMLYKQSWGGSLPD